MRLIMTRKLFLLICCIFLFITKSNPQSKELQSSDLIGLWQVNNTLVAAGLDDCYRFYKDGRFRFEVSSFNYLSRLVSVSGTWQLKDKELHLTVTEAVESVGGEVTFGDEADYNNWNIAGTKRVKKKYDKPKEYILPIQNCDKGKVKGINLDYLKFFRISSNPDAEKG